ncbi:MAG: hypothetical protein JRI46_11360 [Deltaproteobacteria bacterium]|nr:hypothetical protein [Deltaproteobacteria bacterium]
MEALTIIIAVIALIIAIGAYQKAGAIADLKKQADVFTKIGDSIIKTTDSLRIKTADILDKMEAAVRGTEEGKEEPRARKKKEEKE